MTGRRFGTAADFEAFREQIGVARPAVAVRPPSAPVNVGAYAAPLGAHSPSKRSAVRIALTFATLVMALTPAAHAAMSAGSSTVPLPAVASPMPEPGTSPPAPESVDPPLGSVVEFPWLATREDGRPVTWPCGPIRYRLVDAGAPSGAQELLASAMERISAVSGLQFREDPLWRSSSTPDAFSGIEVSWLPRAEIPRAATDTSVAGVGGATATGDHFSHGHVEIVQEWSGSSVTDFSPMGAGSVLLHELGHALGLSHTEETEAIMHPTNAGAVEWSDRERAALRYLRQQCEG